MQATLAALEREDYPPGMTAQDIIRQLQGLDHIEMLKVREWMDDHPVEMTPELSGAIDEGLRSLGAGDLVEYTLDELKAKVSEWAGVSR